MSTTTIADAKYDAFISDVARHAADRETSTLFDYYGVGTLVARHGRDRDAVKADLVKAYRALNVQASTVNVYLSQGIAIAGKFETWNALETFCDDELKGSRSLKRVYDAIKAADKPESPATDSDETPAVESPATALVDVVLAGLANLKNAADIARVRDAAIAMLKVSAAA